MRLADRVRHLHDIQSLCLPLLVRDQAMKIVWKMNWLMPLEDVLPLQLHKYEHKKDLRLFAVQIKINKVFS